METDDLKRITERLKRMEGRLTDLGGYVTALTKELRQHKEGHIKRGPVSWMQTDSKEQ